MDAIKARVPGLSKTLKPRRDLYGRKIINSGAYGPDIISPFYKSTHKPNAIDEEIWSLRAKITKHPDALQFDDAPPDSPIELSDDERDWFHQRAGELTLKNLTKLIVTRNSSWENKKRRKGKEWAIEEIRREVREAREKAEKELLKHPVFGRDLKARIKELKYEKKEEERNRRRM